MVNEIENQSWIGRTVSITYSPDSGLIGRSGMVADETRETITILENDNQIVIGKKSIKFKINDSQSIIDGALMRQRPEERIYRNKRSM